MAHYPPEANTPVPAPRVLDRLLAEKKISRLQYDSIVQRWRQDQGEIDEAVMAVTGLSEAELLKMLAALYTTRFVTTEKLVSAALGSKLLAMVPRKLAERATVLPVLYDESTSTLSVVTSEPDHVQVLEEIRLFSRARNVKALVGRTLAVKAAIAKFYAGDSRLFAAMRRSRVTSIPPMIDVFTRDASRDTMASPPEPEFERPQSIRPEKAAPLPAPRHTLLLETLNVLVSLLENNRPDLRGHSAHVGRLTRKVCERMKLADRDTDEIIIAALLHDLGKSGIYHLTALNVAQYERHTSAAKRSYLMPVRLMQSAHLPESTVRSLVHMYERFDGKGFPDGMSEKEIPLGSRVLAITDTYSDLTQNPNNPFREVLRPTEATDILAQHKDKIFDKDLVDLFRQLVAGDDLKAKLLKDRPTALLVDPDPEETTILELRMIEQGFEVTIVRKADEAQKVIAKGEIDLVVSEVDLEPFDGLTLLDRVRSNDFGGNLAWVFLSARAGREDIGRGFELGAADYVEKPVNAEILVAKLRKLVDQGSSASRQTARGVKGSLEEMALTDMVQILSQGRKSGALRIRNANESGELLFVGGEIYDAAWGKARGADAVYAMLRLKSGDFTLDPNFKAEVRVIEMSVEGLLLEGMRRLDEDSRPAARPR